MGKHGLNTDLLISIDVHFVTKQVSGAIYFNDLHIFGFDFRFDSVTGKVLHIPSLIL